MIKKGAGDMDTKLLILLIVIAVALIIYYRPFGSTLTVRKRCMATVPGHYVYSEGYYKSQGIGGGVTYMVPVYEYTVNDNLYMTIVEGMEQSYNVFPLDVEVKYNPKNPGVCFIEDKRGKVIKKK